MKENSKNIPEHLIKYYEDISDKYWRGVAMEKAKREDGPQKGEEFENYYKAFLKKVDQKTQELFEKAEVWMRRRPDAFLWSLKQRCGRFTTSINQALEDGQSIPKLAQRDMSEKTLYGYPENHPMERRLLYTYGTEHPKGEPNPEISGYGLIAIHCKSSVKERSSKFLGDPWLATDGKTYLDGRPVPYHEANKACFPIRWEFVEDDGNAGFTRRYNPDSMDLWRPCRMKYEDLSEYKSVDDIFPWPEVEVHAGLTVDDIEKVIFANSKQLDDEMKGLLKEYDIPYDVSDQLNMNWVNDHLAVGGYIDPVHQINTLACEGIMHIVDTRAEECDNSQELKNRNIEFLYLPTPDNQPLSIEDLMKGTQWVDERLKKGERVLIHCEHGTGRSPLLTCAVLVRQGMKASEALKLVQERRWQASPNREQRKQLEKFETAWKESQA